MAESVASDVIARLLEYVGKFSVDKMAPYFGGRSNLKELQGTLLMIQARVLDMESLREGEGEVLALAKVWLQRLKNVRCRLEDLLEEVAMADNEFKQLPGGKLAKRLFYCFSGSSPFRTNKKVAIEAKAIIEELNSIASSMSMLTPEFSASIGYVNASASRFNRRETHSFILEEEMIGREKDKQAISNMILETDNNGKSFSVIPIVGIGGLGKTALAQLIFNDENVQEHFELKGWASISDVSCLKELIGELLKSITEEDHSQLSLEQLQSRLRDAVYDKKYFFVLDDIWNEDRESWLSLRALLCSGRQGSTVIVTSRSRVVAEIMGTIEPYELEGLSEEKSWDLFRNLAFKEGQSQRNPALISIGKKIVEKCANVPLVIRTIAGLLYSKDTEKEWESFKDMELQSIEQNEKSILSTLKLSYIHLPLQLKQCFAHCSLFPKGHVFQKQHLIYLWMAQGFTEPSKQSNETLEDVGHDHFMQLLRKSFFQDVTRNEYGDIVTCKMHDLMLELARNVVEDECLLVDGPMKHIIENTTSHVSLDVGSSWEAPRWFLAAKQIRSFILLSSSDILNLNEICSSLRCLRSLDLAGAGLETLPTSVGELKHLRYLRLGGPLQYLPECITKLQNLQTLDVRDCYNLRGFPRSFTKLINLRHWLVNNELEGWISMPSGIGQLTSLQTLDLFVVQCRNGLEALSCLYNLGGKLEIRFENLGVEAASQSRGEILGGMKVTDLVLRWPLLDEEPTAPASELKDELALQHLQPPPSLKKLAIWDWKGARFPSWGIDVFPYLVSVELVSCNRCNSLPFLSRFPHLRNLQLWDLQALEYFETGCEANENPSDTVYFPSLARLELLELHQLKALRRNDGNHERVFFPCLVELTISDCSQLMSFPMAPTLEVLDVREIQARLLKHLLCTEETLPSSSSQTSSPSSLREVHLNSVYELESFTINRSVDCLTVSYCNQMTTLLAESPVSIRVLEIHNCTRLRNISREVQHLINLNGHDDMVNNNDEENQMSLFEMATGIGRDNVELPEKVDMTRCSGKGNQRKRSWPLRSRKRHLSRLVPGTRKLPLPDLLHETVNYISALTMQVNAMTELARMLDISESD